MSKCCGQSLRGLLYDLYVIQLGLCFHCGSPMLITVPQGESRSKGWTREHIYPKAGYPYLLCNIVLAHPRCNAKKGGRDPTPEEIERAAKLYRRLGLMAFVAYRGYGSRRLGNRIKGLEARQLHEENFSGVVIAPGNSSS